MRLDYYIKTHYICTLFTSVSITSGIEKLNFLSQIAKVLLSDAKIYLQLILPRYMPIGFLQLEPDFSLFHLYYITICLFSNYLYHAQYFYLHYSTNYQGLLVLSACATLVPLPD